MAVLLHIGPEATGDSEVLRTRPLAEFLVKPTCNRSEAPQVPKRPLMAPTC